MATSDEIYRQAVRSRNPQAILNVAKAFRAMGEPEKAVTLEGRAYSLSKFNFAFGADIAAIQARLNTLGANPPLTVDGISGPKTVEAIKSFQSSHGITPDGIVGPITLAALGMSGTETAPIVSSSGNGIIAVKGLETKSNAFKNKLVQIANTLGINPDWLASVISLETAGTFSSSIQNPYSKATGLIQFIAPTATKLGTSLDALKRMSDIDQLDYVYKYYLPYKGKMKNLADTYLAVFMPSQMGKGSDAIVASEGSKVYEQNSGFDHDQKGYFTVGDITNAIHGVYNVGVSRGRIPVGVAIAAGGIGLGALLGIGFGTWYLLKKR
jgi:peptidoglycan hydrolase-like protein with peptidoglycan-binding domain